MKCSSQSHSLQIDCRYCLSGHHSVCDTLRTTHFDPGGFAEFIRVPKINVETGTFLLPEERSCEEGSFIEPLACIVRAQRFAKLRAEQSVRVIGSGISGLLHIQLAKARGAGPIIATDINDFRLKAAKELGADTVVICDTHWVINAGFHINANERFKGVFTSNEFPQFIQNLEYDYKGNPSLGDAIARCASTLNSPSPMRVKLISRFSTTFHGCSPNEEGAIRISSSSSSIFS